MRHGLLRRIIYNLLFTLIILILFLVIKKFLLPLLLGFIFGIVVKKKRKKKHISEVASQQLALPPPQTAYSQKQVAIGEITRNITRALTTQYPNARWVWETPRAIEKLYRNESVTILVNRAGGYTRATVFVRGMQFQNMEFEQTQKEAHADNDGSIPVNYSLLAYEWVSTQITALNMDCNEAIADDQASFHIPIARLPEPTECWSEICRELVRQGFASAITDEGGITVGVPHINYERN